MEILGNETVIGTTYKNVVATKLFDEVFVATDSDVIFNEITRHGGKAVMTGEHETGSDRIAEAVRNIECDIVINVQGDEPFLKTEPLQPVSYTHLDVYKRQRHGHLPASSPRSAARAPPSAAARFRRDSQSQPRQSSPRGGGRC